MRGRIIIVLCLTVFLFSAELVDSAATQKKDDKTKKTANDAVPFKADASIINPDYADFLGKWRYKMSLVRAGVLAEQPISIIEDPSIYYDDVVAEFNCNPMPPSSSIPTSVNEIRPADIKVVSALGDSITASMGVRASNLIEVIIMNRGESWSIGGDKMLEHRVLTIPNILRKFNPNVTGASQCRRGTNHEVSALNVAVPGDTNRGMKDQADNLMKLMLENPDIDYYNDWKLVTIFIGGNDLCRQCQNPENFGPDAFYEGIKNALDLFYNHLPRAIINVQPMFDISIVRDLNHTGELGKFACNLLHNLDCPCGMTQSVAELTAVKDQYYEKMLQLTSGRYDLRKDFTVVMQPHLKDFIPPKDDNGKYDMSFVAPDCFHPSHKAHQAFAYTLWNTMLTPVGQKPLSYPPEEKLVFKCPTESAPFIYTNCNSGDPKPDYCSYSQSGISAVETLAAGFTTVVLASLFASLMNY